MPASSARNTTATFVLALWWGSLTVVGIGVVPLLFASMEAPQAAGRMAAVLFAAQDWLGWLCGAVLAVFTWENRRFPLVGRAKIAILIIAFSMCAAAVSHWLVAPQIVARQNLKLWHSLGSILYFSQWLAVTALMALHHRARSQDAAP